MRERGREGGSNKRVAQLCLFLGGRYRNQNHGSATERVDASKGESGCAKPAPYAAVLHSRGNSNLAWFDSMPEPKASSLLFKREHEI